MNRRHRVYQARIEGQSRDKSNGRGLNVVAYRPTKVIEVLQAEPFEVTVRRDGWPMTVLGLTCAP